MYLYRVKCPAILYILTSYLYYSETLPSCNSAELFFSEQQDGLAGWGGGRRESGQGEGTPVKIGIFELSFSRYFSRDSLYIHFLPHKLVFYTENPIHIARLCLHHLDISLTMLS